MTDDPWRTDPSAAPGPAAGPRLDRHLATLARRRRLVAAIVVVAALAAALAASLRDRPYEATAQVLVDQHQVVDAFLGTEGASADPVRDAATNVRLAGLQPVATAVDRRLRLHEAPGAVLSRVTVAPDSDTNLVSITARAGDGPAAARLANAFAEEYRAFRATTAQDAVRAAVTTAQAQLRALGPTGQASRLGHRLGDQIDRLRTVGAFQTGGVQVVRRADVPAAPAGRGPRAAALLGGLLGLLVAGAAIVVLTRTDRRVHGARDVEEALGVPVLAGPGDPEATLAARLAHGAGRPADVVLITSTEADEGAPEAALELARGVRRLGRSAVLVEGDLREGRVGRLTRVRGGGVAAVLRGRSDLADELTALPRRAGERDGSPGAVLVLPAGRGASGCAPLVGGPALDELLGHARAWADVVVVAGAPLARPADVLPLVPRTGAVVLVAQCDRTAADALVRARAELGGALVGAVVTQAPARRHEGLHRARRAAVAAAAAARRWWPGRRTPAASDDAAAPAPRNRYPTSEVTRP